MILIVDDHTDTREALLRLLKREGYEAIGVTGGQEALLFLQTHRPRLVILDYNMPDMDGLSVFAEMRRDERLAAVRVIMFSASSGDLKQQALAAGMDGFVAKSSLDWAVLRTQISQWAGPANPPAVRVTERTPRRKVDG
jgi:CheY-like chemotaxis protein